ncbi:AAA family ATPase [Herbidospora daliensis]|uniref:AAA family ATPase n=1 Tax=Herbidospora daliensis TaxID=295585 RepID=UPI0007832728|nr:AAA family ATPase [Herbidospora daliensis]
MRLHRLTISAFGSFPGTEEVDFDRLGEAGLFLIHGPTGAGKTTILDAVCCALFGVVPGRRNDARSLRCDHAPPGRGPQVVLETTIRGRTLRVTRSPAWARPKLRGQGTTQEQAKVIVQELRDGDWAPVTTRIDEAGDFIGGLLGMNAEQFGQVVMLPQGEFARFLRASGDDRRKLLERLFTVRVFTDMERWLADHRRETGRVAEHLADEVRARADRMRGAAGPELAALAGESDDPLEWSSALLSAASAAVTSAEAAVSDEALRQARDRLAEARDLADRQRRHTAARIRHDELEARADERADLETILEEAASASRVVPLLDQLTAREQTASTASAAFESGTSGLAETDHRRAERTRRDELIRLEEALGDEARLHGVIREQAYLNAEIATLEKGLRETADRLEAATAELSEAEQRRAAAAVAEAALPGAEAARSRAADLLEAVRRRDTITADLAAAMADREAAGHPALSEPELTALERDRRDELARLDALDGEEARLTALRADRESAETEAARLAGVEAELADRLTTLPGLLAEAAARLASSREQAAALPSARARLVAAEERLEAVIRRDELAADLALAEDARRVAVDAAQSAVDRLQEIRQARIDGMAAELAARLAEGDPCAVCGSPDHPAPAEPSSEMATADDEEAAQAEADAAQSAREAAESTVASLEGRHERAADTADGLSQAEAEQAREEARTDLAVVEAAAAREPAHRDEVTRLEAALGDVREAEAETALALRELQTRQQTFAEEEGRIEVRLSAALDPGETVSSRRTRLTAEAMAIGAALAAETKTTTLTGLLDEARRQVAATTRGTGLASPDGAGLGIETDPDDDPVRVGGGRELAGEKQAEAVDLGSDVRPLRADPAVWPDVPAAQALLARTRQAVEELAAVLDGRLAAREAAEHLTREVGELKVKESADTTLLMETRAARGRFALEESDLTTRLGRLRGDDASIYERAERLRAEAEAHRHAAEVSEALTEARRELAAARTAALAAAVDAGFAGLDDLAAARRTPAEIDEMGRRLRELAAELAAVVRTLADPELTAAAAQPPPDLHGLQQAHDEADAARSVQVSARDSAVARLTQLTALAAELAEAQARRAPAERRHRLARRMAELANGTSPDNQWDMPLSSYVLGERLRQVADAANERLTHMSDGRYLLQYDVKKTAGHRGRSGGGLGLRVLDAWTGVDRDPATLSGGESFITSLALALGLADVVAAEAGGAEIGTLFVDEGFGTLDEETLDDVLDILDSLREGGRAVGVVSHVAELRVRIPAQLRVHKGRAGSTLR